MCTPMGPSRQLRCYAIVQHTAVRYAGIWGGLYVSVQHCRMPQSFFSLKPSWPGFAVWISRSVRQAEEAVANLPLRLAVRVHYDQPSVAGYSRGTHSLQGHTGVLTAYSRGAHSLYGYTATGQHAARDALPPAERAFPCSPAGSSARAAE